MHKLKKRQLLVVLVINLIFLLYRSVDPSVFVQSKEPQTVQISQVTVSDIPVKAVGLIEPITGATAAYITDENSGSILWSKNPDTLYAPASTTKLITAIIARRVFRPGTVLTVQRDPSTVGGSVIGLRKNDQLTVESLIEAALIQSGNDAAQALADNYPGGNDAFVEEMNRTAAEIHMDSTHFSNPTGFDAPQHHSTARDLSILAREAIKDSYIKKIVSTKEEEISDITGKKKFKLHNTNQLLGADPRVIGLKTGTTEEAGEVLITLVQDEDRTILFVVLGSQSRYTDTQQLMDWIFNNYSWLPPEEVSTRIQRVE